MSTPVKNNYQKVVAALNTQDPASFLGNDFYRYLNDINTEKGRKTWELEDFLEPSGMTFLNPLNPLFLSDISELSLIQYVPFVMARDGVYGIVDFFHRFPKPTDFYCTVILPENFAPLVPACWGDYVLFYRYTISKKIESSSSKTLFVKGILSPSALHVDDVLPYIEEVKLNDPSRIIAYLPERTDHFCAKKKDRAPYYYFLQELYRALPCPVELLGWKDFAQSAAQAFFVDLNSSSECIYDDYLVHLLLAKGNLPLGVIFDDSTNSGHIIKLSPHHSLQLLLDHPSDVSSLSLEIERMKVHLLDHESLCLSGMIDYLQDLSRKRLPKQKWYYSL